MNARISSCALVIFLCLISCSFATAENIDPVDNDSQYAYGENIGWCNLEPLGDGGSGVEVTDSELRGWMWCENIGWASLSCENTSSCGTAEYRVLNDGQGVLSGYAWAENVGWINFAPATSGVTIDPVTGEFDGKAWGENIGWLSFRSDGIAPFVISTGWTGCSAPLPAGDMNLEVSRGPSSAVLSWTAHPDAAMYDVATGNGLTLHGSGGDFSVSTGECLINDTTALTAEDSQAWLTEGISFYLVRAQNCAGAGSYDTGGLLFPRDPEIDTSGNDCSDN